MPFDLIELTFLQPLRGSNVQQGYLPSDQLWGALYAADATLQGETLPLQGIFQVSSAFPFAGREWLLPKPRISARRQDTGSSDSSAKKELKGLRFVGLKDFLQLAAGEPLSTEELKAALARQRRALLPVRAQESGLPLPDDRTIDRLLKSLRLGKGADQYAREQFAAPLSELSAFEKVQLAWLAQGRATSGKVERQRNTQDRVTQATDTFMSGEVAPPRLGFLLATSSSEQRARLLSALRLLADDGLGGQRSHGSGQFAFEVLPVPAELESRLNVAASAGKGTQVLLNLVHPTRQEAAQLDQAKEASYGLIRRDSFLSGSAWLRQDVWMLTEGSVLPSAVKGSVQDVRPPGYPHAVYRSGLALSLEVAS